MRVKRLNRSFFLIAIFMGVVFPKIEPVFVSPPMSGDWIITGTESYELASKVSSSKIDLLL